MPCPPPIHRVASPIFASLRFISYIKVVSILAPDAPIGCPIEIAPPFTLTFFWSKFRPLLTAIQSVLKRRFASIKSMSSIFKFAFNRAAFVAGTGP